MNIVTKIQSWLFNNQTTGQTIAKNAFWLFFGQIMGRLLRASIVIYAARVLGAAEWGAFSYALGVAAFLTIFSDIGINALVTKEASRKPELKDQYLSTAFFTKLALVSILIIVALIVFPYLTNIEAAMGLMPILIFVFAFDTLRDLGSALSRALEKMEIEALVHIFTNLAIVIIGFLLLGRFGTSLSLATAYAIGSGLGLLAIIAVLWRHFKNIFSNFNKALVKEILATAWPFGLLGLMGVINLNTDIVMLGWIRTAEEVGYYSAAQKIIQLLYILPAVFASGVFPALSRIVQNDRLSAKKLLRKTVMISMSAAVIFSAIGIFGADLGVETLFGKEYLPAVSALQILMATLLVVYPSTLLGNAIFAYDHQKSFVWLVLAAIFGNIFFNILLIPNWGIEGAAVSTLITQLIINTMIWLKIKKIGGI